MSVARRENKRKAVPCPHLFGFNHNRVAFFGAIIGVIAVAVNLRGVIFTGVEEVELNRHRPRFFIADCADIPIIASPVLAGKSDIIANFSSKNTRIGPIGWHILDELKRRWGFAEEGQPGMTIGCDNYQGGYAAAEHLISLGRKSIAFLGDASTHYPECEMRYKGACAAMTAVGVEPQATLQVDAITTEQAGFDAATILIKRGTAFDAIFAASDLIAIGAIRALEECGRAVPSDVAIIGFDDIPAASLAHPPLTTIQQDLRLAGAALVDGVLEQIRNEKVRPTVLPVKLVVRKSCGASG